MNERVELLEEAIKLTTQDCNLTYGSFVDNMTALGELWDVYQKWSKDKYTDAHDSAMYMTFAKLSRIMAGPKFHRDNYTDVVNYIAAAYECEYAHVPQKLDAEEKVDKILPLANLECPVCRIRLVKRKDYFNDLRCCLRCTVTWLYNGKNLEKTDIPFPAHIFQSTTLCPWCGSERSYTQEEIEVSCRNCLRVFNAERCKVIES